MVHVWKEGPATDRTGKSDGNFRLWVKAVQQAGTKDHEVVRKTVIGMEAANLSGGSTTLLTHVHLNESLCTGEIRPYGQYNVIWYSPQMWTVTPGSIRPLVIRRNK